MFIKLLAWKPQYPNISCKRKLALIICLIAICCIILTDIKCKNVVPLALGSSCEQQGEPQVKELPEAQQAFETAVDVLTAIKNRDYLLLAEYAHPEKGIIFSPDPNVNYDEDTVFQAEEIRLFESDRIYDWGYYDASEIPLRLTANDYFSSYIYVEDFLNCHQIGINSIVKSGNCQENVTEVFPDGVYVDFHYEGTEEFELLDWESLKIVMEKYDGNFKVVAIINSQYTL